MYVVSQDAIMALITKARGRIDIMDVMITALPIGESPDYLTSVRHDEAIRLETLYSVLICAKKVG